MTFTFAFNEIKGGVVMLEIIMGRAKTGKSNLILQKIKKLGDTGRQVLLVPEHASYQAEIDFCRVCGDTASRHAEVLSFQRLCNRVMTQQGGLAKPSLDAGGKLLTLQMALIKTAPLLKVYRHPSQRSAFLRKLLDLFDEFRSYGVEPKQLMDETEHMEGVTREKLRDLSFIYAEYEAMIHHENCDARDCVSKLYDALKDSDYVSGADIFIDGFALQLYRGSLRVGLILFDLYRCSSSSQWRSSILIRRRRR